MGVTLEEKGKPEAETNGRIEKGNKVLLLCNEQKI